MSETHKQGRSRGAEVEQDGKERAVGKEGWNKVTNQVIMNFLNISMPSHHQYSTR